MAAVNLATLAPPIILSENYLNGFSYEAGDLIATDGQDFIYRLYDGVPESLYATLESDDTKVETINGGLYIEGSKVVRSADFLALRGMNLKSYTFELLLDSSVVYSYVKTNETLADRLISIASPVDCNEWRLTMNTVRGDGGSPSVEQKQIGCIDIALVSGQLSRGYAAPPTANPLQNVISARLASGNVRSSFRDRADEGHEHYRASVEFAYMSDADRAILTAARKAASLLFVPWPGDHQSEIYLGRMEPGSYRERRTDTRKELGWSISFDFEETGGS